MDGPGPPEALGYLLLLASCAVGCIAGYGGRPVVICVGLGIVFALGYYVIPYAPFPAVSIFLVLVFFAGGYVAGNSEKKRDEAMLK